MNETPPSPQTPPVGGLPRPVYDPANTVRSSLTDPNVAADVAVLQQAQGQPVSVGSSERVATPKHPGKDKGTLHGMPPQGKEVAARYGFTTTDRNLPPEPGSLAEVRRGREFERKREEIAARTERIFAQIQSGPGAVLGEAARNGTLGSELAKTFGYIKGIHAEGVHEQALKRPVDVDGRLMTTKAVADKVTFTVSSPAEAELLDIALQGLQHDPDRDFFPTTRPDGGEKLAIGGPSEGLPRSANTAIDILLEQEEKAKQAAGEPTVALPEGPKRSLKDLKAAGETFSPEHEAQLEQIDRGYAQLDVSATYRDGDGNPVALTPKRKEHLHAWDHAPALAGWRDVYNSLIDATRGNNRLEQDPDGDIAILKDIPMTRDPKAEGGPGAARLPTPRERMSVGWRDLKEEYGEHRARLILKTAGMVGSVALSVVPGFGAMAVGTTVGGSVASKLPELVDAVKHYPGDVQAYRVARRRADSTNAAIRQLQEDLRQTG